MRILCSLLLTLCLLSCGGEGALGGTTAGAGTGTSAGSAAAEMTGEGYCIHTFQIDLADKSGRAMVRVCLTTNDETKRYLQKHRDYSEAIRQRFIRIVQSNSLEDLQMPGARTRIQQEMLAAAQEQMEPLGVDAVELQRFELW